MHDKTTLTVVVDVELRELAELADVLLDELGDQHRVAVLRVAAVVLLGRVALLAREQVVGVAAAQHLGAPRRLGVEQRREAVLVDGVQVGAGLVQDLDQAVGRRVVGRSDVRAADLAARADVVDVGAGVAQDLARRDVALRVRGTAGA